jgi:hypothetical protein
MPRIILKDPPKPPEHDKLVQRLAQELQAPSAEVQPLILEQPIEATSSRHVHVIWDLWKDLSEEQRWDVIRDAYAAAECAGAVGDITLASGVAPQEAVVLGLLPFKVAPGRTRHEGKPPTARYRKVLEAEARKTLLSPEADALRYPRLEDAEEVRARLEKALPGSEWAVV